MLSSDLLLSRTFSVFYLFHIYLSPRRFDTFLSHLYGPTLSSSSTSCQFSADFMSRLYVETLCCFMLRLYAAQLYSVLDLHCYLFTLFTRFTRFFFFFAGCSSSPFFWMVLE